MSFFSRLWGRSIVRFYWLNAKWNLGFWLNAKPCYEDKTYTYVDETLDLDKNLNDVRMQFEFDKKTASYRRFKGYMYNGGIYWDNPGVQRSVDAETREHWFRKRWI